MASGGFGNSFQSSLGSAPMVRITLEPSFQPPVGRSVPSAVWEPDNHQGLEKTLSGFTSLMARSRTMECAVQFFFSLRSLGLLRQ